ncbi:Vacuolar morphogenesis protein 6 [Coemansia sp. Benny D115]|nr:Vacuolar morphogenesis protein 6 [Coemansia sp. Benny D115]
MHHAFSIRAVLKQLPVRIESAAAYGDRLLLGTSSGALLVYKVTEPTAPRQHVQVTLIETKKAFARRAIEHLSVIKEAGVLVCQADGLVTLYDLHTLSNATPLSNTKGAGGVAVYTAVDHIDGIPTLVSKLAVHARRKVVVLEWRDAEFYKSFDYSAADRITAMQFASPNLLVLATAREFLTLQLPIGQWDDLFPADTASLRTVAGVSLGAVQGVASSQPANSTANSGMWGAWGIGLSTAGTEPKTTIARMPGDRLLLCHEDIGVLLNAAGKPCNRESTEPMSFTHAPTGITHTSAYAIAISAAGPAANKSNSNSSNSNSNNNSGSGNTSSASIQTKFNVEVRNIATRALVQTLHLSEEAPTAVINGAGGKQVWAIGAHTVWRLVAVPIQQQVEDVLGAGQYDEALSLVAQSDGILESERLALTTKIRWLRARWLFRDQAKYELALDEFADLDATPTEAIALCPERIAGDLAEEDEDEDEDENENENEDNTECDTAQPGDRTAVPASEPDGGSDPVSDADGQSVAPKKKTAPKQVIWKEALYALMRYLTEHRRRLQKSMAEDQRCREYVVRMPAQDDDEDDDDGGNSNGNSDSGDDNDSLPHIRLKRLAFALERMEIPVAAMAQVVDTTLLRIYLECSPGLLGPLLRVRNHCDVELSEGLLLEHRRYAELVDLYHGKALFRNALQLLQRQGKAPDHGSLSGSYPTVRYLLRLPAEQFELILEYVRWPLQIGLAREKTAGDSGSSDDADMWPSPESIVSMVFADDRPAAEAFPRPRVSTFLRQVAPQLATQYLAYVFASWNDQTAALHDDMVAAYLDQLQRLEDKGAQLDLRQHLQRFLRSSRAYSPERALARLPDGSLFEERALVLSRLGRHEQALGLLVFSVASMTLAEQYCIDNAPDAPDVFVQLLRILVSQPPADVIDSEGALIANGSISTADSDPQAPMSSAQVEGIRRRMHRDFAAHLLSTHHRDIPAADALRILPADMELSADVLEYLRSQLCLLDQNVRGTTVVRSLRVGEDQQTRRQVSRLQSSFVVVTETRTCPHCFKRIGAGTAFAVIPPSQGHLAKGPVVVHYSCWQRHKSATPDQAADPISSHNGGAQDHSTPPLSPGGSSHDSSNRSLAADDDETQGAHTATIATFALAVAGTAFAADAPAPKGKNAAAAPAAAAPAPEARTVTVTTTVDRNSAGMNQVSFAAAALAGALAFASYM